MEAIKEGAAKYLPWLKKFVTPMRHGPLDTWIMFVHCPLTILLIQALTTMAFSFYSQDDYFSCTDLGGGLDPLLDPVKFDICFSFSYVKVGERDKIERIFNTNYRWFPHQLQVLALFMIIPYYFKKQMVDRRLEAFISKIKFLSPEKIRAYWRQRQGNHAGMAAAPLQLSLICLYSDLSVFFILDTITGGIFHRLPMEYPFNRDMARYLTQFSQVFPPFTQCTISPKMQIILQRTENYGCQMPYNVYFEKIVICLFVYLSVVTLATLLSILVHLCMLLPCRRLALISSLAKANKLEKLVSRKCMLDDIYVLHCLRNLVPQSSFKALLEISAGKDNAETEK